MKEKCICQRAEDQKHGEMLPTEMTECFSSSIHVYEKGSCIAVICEECEIMGYIKIDYCPYCGRKLKGGEQ